MSAIIITANLNGNVSGFVKHVARQKNTVKVAEGEYITKIILHSDRIEKPCTRSTRVSESIVNQWIHGECPLWENPRDWKKMSVHQKIISYVIGFDEGYGVTYDFL